MRPVLPHGPRGLVMFIYGLFTVLLGALYISPKGADTMPSVVLFISGVIPLKFWGLLWIVVGFTVMVQGFRKNQSLGLWTFAGMNALWGVLHLYSFMHKLLIEHEIKYAVGSLLFLSATVVVLALARMINPIDAKLGIKEDDAH